MDKENTTQESWNKKRIFVTLIMLMLLGVGAYFFKTEILGEAINFLTAKPSKAPESVKGVSINEGQPSIDIQKAVREKIEDLAKEASKIDVQDIASSSPQIQKLIKDLSSIKDYPANQAKEICEKVCGNL